MRVYRVSVKYVHSGDREIIILPSLSGNPLIENGILYCESYVAMYFCDLEASEKLQFEKHIINAVFFLQEMGFDGLEKLEEYRRIGKELFFDTEQL